MVRKKTDFPNSLLAIMHGHVMQFWPMGGKGKPAKGFLGKIFSLSHMQKEKGLTLLPAFCL